MNYDRCKFDSCSTQLLPGRLLMNHYESLSHLCLHTWEGLDPVFEGRVQSENAIFTFLQWQVMVYESTLAVSCTHDFESLLIVSTIVE